MPAPSLQCHIIDLEVDSKMKNKLIKLEFKNYSSFLESRNWKRSRSRFISKFIRLYGKMYCECCFKEDQQFHVHHRSYKRLGRELFDDLILTCSGCHLEIHKLHKLGGISLHEATNKIAGRAIRSQPAVEKSKPKVDQGRRLKLAKLLKHNKELRRLIEIHLTNGGTRDDALLMLESLK